MATRVVNPKIVVNASRSIAALEMYIPHGPKASYALLGAELMDSEAVGLKVVVSVNSVGFRFARSLALPPEETKVGLPEEYANAVLTGAENAAVLFGLPTKRALQFRWAAHGLVSSSPWIFEKVSGLVVRLLTLPRTASDENLKALMG
jgi:hypothetical protein